MPVCAPAFVFSAFTLYPILRVSSMSEVSSGAPKAKETFSTKILDESVIDAGMLEMIVSNDFSTSDTHGSLRLACSLVIN